MAKEYIERETAIKYIRNVADVIGFKNPAVAVDSCVKVLERLCTADVVEVVRCKDCIKRKTPDCSMYYEADGEQYSWEVDDDFCSQGERRDSDAQTD